QRSHRSTDMCRLVRGARELWTRSPSQTTASVLVHGVRPLRLAFFNATHCLTMALQHMRKFDSFSRRLGAAPAVATFCVATGGFGHFRRYNSAKVGYTPLTFLAMAPAGGGEQGRDW